MCMSRCTLFSFFYSIIYKYNMNIIAWRSDIDSNQLVHIFKEFCKRAGIHEYIFLLNIKILLWILNFLLKIDNLFVCKKNSIVISLYLEMFHIQHIWSCSAVQLAMYAWVFWPFHSSHSLSISILSLERDSILRLGLWNELIYRRLCVALLNL